MGSYLVAVDLEGGRLEAKATLRGQLVTLRMKGSQSMLRE